VTLIEATLLNGDRHHLFIPDGWACFTYHSQLFRRLPAATIRQPLIQQYFCGQWRNVRIMTVAIPGARLAPDVSEMDVVGYLGHA
jgi:hypothetical protein